MPLLPAIAHLRLVLENYNLLALPIGTYSSKYRCAWYSRLATGDIPAITDKQNFLQSNPLPSDSDDLLNVYNIARSHPVLLTSGFNNSVNTSTSF